MRTSDWSSDVCSSDLSGGPLDYQVHGSGWGYWLSGHEALLIAWGIALVLLTAVYSWATMAFGIRFSNLTHRGVITHGPYAFTRHQIGRASCRARVCQDV